MTKRKMKKLINQKLKRINIVNFSKNDFFIFDVTKILSCIYKFYDLNAILATEDEKNTIIKNIDDLIANNEFIQNSKTQHFDINQNFYRVLKSMKKIDRTNTFYGSRINYIISKYKRKDKIKLKNLCEIYFNIYKEYISKTTISRNIKT